MVRVSRRGVTPWDESRRATKNSDNSGKLGKSLIRTFDEIATNFEANGSTLVDSGATHSVIGVGKTTDEFSPRSVLKRGTSSQAPHSRNPDERDGRKSDNDNEDPPPTKGLRRERNGYGPAEATGIDASER